MLHRHEFGDVPPLRRRSHRRHSQQHHHHSCLLALHRHSPPLPCRCRARSRVPLPHAREQYFPRHDATRPPGGPWPDGHVARLRRSRGPRPLPPSPLYSNRVGRDAHARYILSRPKTPPNGWLGHLPIAPSLLLHHSPRAANHLPSLLEGSSLLRNPQVIARTPKPKELLLLRSAATAHHSAAQTPASSLIRRHTKPPWPTPQPSPESAE